MKQQSIVDEFSNVHRLLKLLGRGGQGAVYRTTDPDVALKLLTDDAGEWVTEPTLLARFNEQLLNLRILPLPEHLNLSMPVARLKDKDGYLMPLLDEMMPLAELFPCWRHLEQLEDTQIPPWLERSPKDSAKLLLHYCHTGGLRRRLLLLSKCAAVLARLHGAGLVYGDLSPQNLFVSSDPNRNEVWFIDADNLRFETTNSRFAVYTPGFGAPEIVRGQSGCRPSTDCYSFAIVAFYLLSTIHPFNGALCQSEEDWADDEGDGGAETQAQDGLLPWVDDCDDRRNKNSGGLPRELLLNTKLKTLFQQTFGPGRLKPKLRPTIFHWPQALAEAADSCIQCPSCSMSFHYDVACDCCPYCKADRPQTLHCTAYYRQSNGRLSSPVGHWVSEFVDNNGVDIPHRLLCGFVMIKAFDRVLTFKLSGQFVEVEKAESFAHPLKVAVNQPDFERFVPLHVHLDLSLSELVQGLWIYVENERPRLLHCCVQGATK